MLSSAGSRTRRPTPAAKPARNGAAAIEVPAAPDPTPVVELPSEAPERSGSEAELAATAPASSERRSSPPENRLVAVPHAAAPSAAPEEDAPRTHRLDQRTANDLRAAWLEARRRGE